jgi:hypothetical protein
MRRVIFSILILLAVTIQVHAQAAADAPEQKQAEDFIKRLNALSDWYLSLDGKEAGLDKVVDSMMEVYAPDVLAEVPPNDKDQIGPILLRGKDNVRKWVERIARTQVRLLYYMRRQTDGPTGDFEGWRLVYSAKLPWGGNGITFPVMAVWSQREDRKRFTASGMITIQTGTDGKIRRLRILIGEIEEVEAL